MEMFDENNKYVSLANKYRPQTFEDMVGQENISKTLKNALKLGRIAHAYLFYGPRGCGKTTTARILAKALNCTGNGHTKPTDEPCGKCPQCLEIAQSSDLDVLELDAASNTQVEKVREAIIDTVALASSRDRFKVFILDEVHMLSTSSFNALLKTIEEPPAHVVFILATTEKHKVPATIVSRCQTFRFRPITVDEISNHLLDLAGAENIDLTPAAARIIAKNAGGAMRDALTLLDRAIAYSGERIDEKLVGEMLGLTPDELIAQAVNALTQKDSAALHQVFETLKNEGFDANAFLKDLKNTLGDLFYFSLGQGEEPFDGAKAITAQVSSGFLAALSRKVNKLIEEVKFSDNTLVSAEVGLFTVMDSCLDIDGFIRRLEALERGEVSSSRPSGLAPAPRPAVQAAPVSKPRPHTAAQAAAPAPAPEPAQTHAATDDAVAALLDSDPVACEEPLSTPAVQPAPAMRPEPKAAPAMRPEPKAASGAPLTDRQLWDKLLVHFSKSLFVYDVMLNSRVAFNGDEWTLSFAPGKEFYRVPAQTKLPEMEAAAFQISGRKIKFLLAATPSSAPAPAAPRAAAPARSAAPASKKAEPLSREEPFVKADFSADVNPQAQETKAPQVVPAEDTPEELKDLFSVIPGELMA
ncbi:DNA polymerase III subunit gamma/tau [Candidatus Avelusimicrobium faecicola]|uniref:DNA polymerase III subunit gamma/tau n=1 Tax=Candidatus Avelusimicrobium faecicola TaxID=3416205 RepID=UPI003D0F4335